MTVFRPIVSDDNKRIKQCTAAEYQAMREQIAYLYSQNLVVSLSVVGSGGNISPTMTDERYRSGASSVTTGNNDGDDDGAAEYAGEGTTQEPQLVSATYDKISQTVTDPAVSIPSYTLKPVRVDGTGVREMTETDVIDTFIDPVIDYMEGTGTGAEGGGSFFISTSSSVSGCTNLGTVFTDTRANVGAYTAAQIGTSGTYQDHYHTVNYQLMRINGVSPSYRTPLIVDGTSGLRHMTYTEFNNYFGPLIRRYIYDQSGYTLRYNINGSGTVQGSAMTNRRLNLAGGNYQTRFVGTNDYRAQEFPNGTMATQATWELKLERT